MAKLSFPQKSDFLKLFWTLAESDCNVRTQAAMQLLAHLKHSTKQDTEVQYTLKRLVRGLASSRDAARQGFSTALSGLVATFPKQIALQSTHELLREAMEVHSSMKPMEQREHVFGRLFGLLALHRSGRLSTDLPLLVTVIKELLEMATFKRWFRETCYEAVLTLLVDVPAEQFLTELATVIHRSLQIQPSKGSEEEGVEAWNAEQVLLAVGVQRYLHIIGIDQDKELVKQLPDNFAAVNALQRHKVRVLARPLRGSSGCYPRVHSAWFGVFGYVLNPTEDASATLDVSDDSAPTSHERQGLALKLFELVAPKLPAPVLRAILTPRFVKCLYNNAVAKRNYLHEAARHCLKSFVACAPAKFFHFFRKQFTSPLSILVTSTSADSDEEEDGSPKKKKQKLSAGGFNALIAIEEKKEREDAVKRRTDRARIWTVEVMVAGLLEILSTKGESYRVTAKLQNDVLRFLVFHSFFTLSTDAESTPSKKSKKKRKEKLIETTEIDEVVQEATAASPAVSETVASYVKTRLFSLLSLGLAGADGVHASASVLSRIFAIAKDMQANSATVSLRDSLDDEAIAQCNALAGHVDSLRSKEENEEGKNSWTAEQREDAATVAVDLEKCYVQLGAREQKAIPTKQKNEKKEENELEEMKEEPVVVLTDLLLSILSEDSSALREIVLQVFRSLLPLLNDACLTTITNVLQPTAEAEGTAAGEEDEEFAPIARAALHREDLALAAIVGQVKVRSQRKKDRKRARLQTMHFQLRVLDLLQVFVSQRPEQTEDATVKHNALVLSLVAPLFRVFTRVQTADSEKLVLRDRLQAVLQKVLRTKNKILSDETFQTKALDSLRQIVELIRSTPMDKNHAGKIASAAFVYLVRIICSSESSSDDEARTIICDLVVDAFTKKHSRFPRTSFEELLTKFPAVGIRVLLEPLAAVAAASEKEEDADESEKSLKTALVRQLAPESVQQLKAKRMKVVMMFALQLVKFWCSSMDKMATKADVDAVVAAVQVVDSNSPVVKRMVRQVSEAVGIPFVSTKRTKMTDTTTSIKEEKDELMPVDNDVDKAKKTKVKPNKEKSETTSSQDRSKQKRKRSVADAVGKA
ncbi:unnamed protein product [Peronospora destructor]|uniref:Ribosomal RNA-processing protein 12-like conserved domain-containing protein n=1 Tax=Peronospora destructor TaxID=86335 RepID=A0AAV0UYT0_9STRA|nr:unnamed protein product [Peronospora destructor]